MLQCLTVTLRYLQAMTDSMRGEVTARMSILHSLIQYAIPARSQFPIVQSRLIITPAKVLCSTLNHSISGEIFVRTNVIKDISEMSNVLALSS